jgi:hypothetical protein
MIRKIATVLASIVLFGWLGLATRAEAGAQFQSAGCVKNWDGSGYCHGSFNGFRYSSSAWAYAVFSVNSYYDGIFSANDGLRSGWCSVPRDSALFPFFLQAATTRSYFYVSWDASARCVNLQVDNSSIN